MKRNLITLLLVFFLLSVYGQNNSLKSERIYLNSPKEDKFDLAFDSAGMKQGKWSEDFDYFAVIYSHEKRFILEDAKGKGFYIDNKKNNTWEIYSSEIDGVERMYAQCFYIEDSLIYTLFYEDFKIKSLLRSTDVPRYNNIGITGTVKFNEFIVFDKKGKISFRESYAPDGIFERLLYSRLEGYKSKSKKKRDKKVED
ncbi:MAG: hypothetical protein DRI74_06875 [Bacteroidetes bacterium]|nr:MAG: hypothetical protein DRI74_06875 [Bacteroidota bacterium]